MVRKFIPQPIISLYHHFLAFLGALLFRFPSRHLTIIGVTGTNGKSTVVYLIARLLEDVGYRVAVSSTIEFQVGERKWPNTYKMTMPGRFFLQKFLRQAVDAGCRYAVVEVTSEGILQHRHRFIDWSVAVFTNLSPEHVERHGSYTAYRNAKGELFRGLKMTKRQQRSAQNNAEQYAEQRRTVPRSSARGPTLNVGVPRGSAIVVNLADKEAGYFLQFPADRYFGFRLRDQGAQALLPEGGQGVVAEIHDTRRPGLPISPMVGGRALFMIHGVEFQTPLPGSFNIENWLAAITVGLALGLQLEQMAKTVAKVASIPGRLEEIPNNRGIRIFVDYAHTPAALQKVYEALSGLKLETRNPKSETNPKSQIQNSKLICVLGAAGGGRDKWKRPELGKIAALYCDHIILTNEDPYDENPQGIIENIESGFSQIPNPKSPACHRLRLRLLAGRQIPNYEKVLDRKGAIRKAIAIAQPGDVVIITGKGSEPWMMIAGGKKIPWDDREAVSDILGEK